MLRLFLFISLFLGSLIISTDVSAAVTYIPGPLIAMTGSNSDVRFDVAAPLMGYDASGATLVTATKTFTGAFYGSGIGWIIFSTGTYQVALDCGAQPLSTLSSDCTLTGTGWSENVGDIYFSSGTTVTYDHNTGLLSGSVITFVGDLSLSGIALPLRPIELKEASMIANSGATLTVSGAWMYEGSGSAWKGKKQIGLGSQAITGLNGLYNSVDFSLAASTYKITIEDPNGSKTEITGFVVSPGTLSTTLDSSSFYAKTFCTTYIPSVLLCPDDTSRTATALVQIPPTGPVIANGTDAYNFTFKARDAYGNRTGSGDTLSIQYQATVKNVQIDPLSSTGNINYGPSTIGDAFKSNKISNNPTTGIYNKNFLLNTIQDITYKISSSAPTNGDNIIQINSIEYNGLDITFPAWKIPLDFSPLYTASISALAPTTPTIGVPHTFTAVVTKNDGISSIVPTIITTMKVGIGISAEWRDFLTDSSIENCYNYPLMTTSHAPCDWTDAISSIATDTDSNFTFTGTYKLTGSFPPVSSTIIYTYIYYKSGSTDILYSSTPPNTPLSPAVPPTLRLRILGQSGNWTNLGSQTRVDLINTIRKNIALLSRNRTDYTNADHIISTGNKTISNADFSGKGSIIVVGGNISITSNISKYPHPIAIIALTDANGNGGNITISGSVTDINSTLIAEHAITSETSNKQLYIYGSVISSNPPQDTAPLTCPYFAPSGCSTPADYDLPNMRSTYDFNPANTSTGGLGYLTPLVIEIDPRLISDAPPAINK